MLSFRSYLSQAYTKSLTTKGWTIRLDSLHYFHFELDYVVLDEKKLVRHDVVTSLIASTLSRRDDDGDSETEQDRGSNRTQYGRSAGAQSYDSDDNIDIETPTRDLANEKKRDAWELVLLPAQEKAKYILIGCFLYASSGRGFALLRVALLNLSRLSRYVP
jgi:hypothetical protein